MDFDIEMIENEEVENEQSLTVSELTEELKELCEQGLGNSVVSFVTPENYNNYYLPKNCVKNKLNTKKRDLVELLLNYWG